MSTPPKLECGSNPPDAPAFQSTMKDLLEQMGSNEKCKQLTDTFFDSGSSTSGENLQTGSALSTTNSNLKSSAITDATKVDVKGPFGLGGGEGNNLYTANKTDTSLNTVNSTNQLNLTDSQADAFSKGAAKMSSEGCGTTVINAAKISNIKQRMNCVIQENMTSSTVNAKGDASILIEQTEFDLHQCMVDAGSDSAAKKACIGLASLQANQFIDLSGANLSQKVDVSIKNKVQLSSDAQQQLASMQQEVANAVVDSKLTSDNGLNGLPPQVKDIKTTDTTINDSCSSTSINQKVQSVSIDVVSGAHITIRTAGSIKAANLVIDQNVMASVVTELLVNDAIKAGLSAADSISQTYSQTNEKSLKSVGEDQANLAKQLAAGNAAAIDSGISPVATAASKQISVDPSKLSSGVSDMNKSAADLVKAQGEAASQLTKETGDANAKDSKAAGDSLAEMADAGSGYLVWVFAIIVVIAIMYFIYKFQSKSPSTSQ